MRQAERLQLPEPLPCRYVTYPYLAHWGSLPQALTLCPVLYHQPDKMIRTKEDLDARKENLERLKHQHGID